MNVTKSFLDRGDGPLLMAHRGGSLERPEATLEAFDHAVSAAVRSDVLELDVHLSSDGHVMVHHDDEVDRTTNGTGRVTSHTRAALEALDAGYRWSPPDSDGVFPWRGQGLVIPAFDVVLARYPEVRINIDIKESDRALMDATIELIEKHNAMERVCLATEHMDVGRWLRERVPDACRGFPAGAVLELMMTLMQGGTPDEIAYDVLQIPVSWEGMPVITPENMARFHGVGVPVHAWTIDEEEEMRSLIGMGIDGIITDRPSLLREILDEGA